MNRNAFLKWFRCFILFALAANLLGAEPGMNRDAVYPRLKARIDQIRLIDTHEHLDSEAMRLKQPPDCLASLLHYTESDLHSAGMPAVSDRPGKVIVQDDRRPFEERWTQFMKFWPEVRFTGYGRALAGCVSDLYGVPLERPETQTGSQINERMVARLKPGFYRWVLKEKARIDLSIVDVSTTEVDREFFAPVMRFDNFVNLSSRGQLENLAAKTGVTINTLEDLVKALEAAFDKGIREGIVGVKSGLAYSRRIYYPMPRVEEARAVLDQLKEGRRPSSELLLLLQNYMMNQVCRLAGEHQLPFQIHTGLQTGFGNDITNSKPTDLINLFKAYPATQFVIFHGSYPYGSELSVLAKNFANVHIDMCWLHIISPQVARNNLAEWIETVPANKIMGFGGDYRFVEGAYIHGEMARENVARVLTQKVTEGTMTEADALELARKFLRENAVRLYRLKLPKEDAAP